VKFEYWSKVLTDWWPTHFKFLVFSTAKVIQISHLNH